MANSSLLKKNNMLDIIKVIKNNSPITKPDVAKKANLTNSTVNSFINELIEKNIVSEEGIADSNGGRRASLYRFNSKIYYVMGLHIGVKSMVISIFDLDLNIIEKIENRYELDEVGVEEGIRFILDLFPKILNIARISRDKVIGLGISVPGPVNFEKGLIYELTNAPKWRNVPLKDIMEKELGITTIIDKDNNCNVLSLKWMDNNREKKNVVYLSTFEGIGTGILIDGKVYRGNHCVAGEIGHISVDINGERCNCGNSGCIELLASNLAIIGKVRKKISRGEKTLISELSGGSIDNIDMDIIIHAAKSQDPLAKEVLWEASRYIGICICNVIKTYDPDEIILHCTWLKEFNDIFYSVMNSAYESTELIRRDDVMITMNTVKDLHIIGAATLVIEYQFKSHENCALLK